MTNVLTTTFDCNGSPCDVATVRNPGESIADLATRHDAAVADAKKDCVSVTATLGALQTQWTAAEGEVLYASDLAYGKPAHDADVVKLKGIYPPE